MSKYDDYRASKQQIERETDAEIQFGTFLERAGVDIVEFMSQWQIDQNQFNTISHYLCGLTEDLSQLPAALAAVLMASRRISPG